MRHSRTALVPIVIATALVAAACGGDDDGDADTGTDTETDGGTEAPAGTDAPAGEDVTLRVLVHQNPPMVAFMKEFNDSFEDANPNVTIDMSVVSADDLSVVTQTRLTANDVDVIDIFGFSNAAQPYMTDVTPPNWQTLIEAGLLLDITDQPFVENFDEATIPTPAPTTARCTRSTSAACPTAACSSTWTSSPRSASRSRPPGTSSSSLRGRQGRRQLVHDRRRRRWLADLRRQPTACSARCTPTRRPSSRALDR
jgi:hypothetical protein